MHHAKMSTKRSAISFKDENKDSLTPSPIKCLVVIFQKKVQSTFLGAVQVRAKGFFRWSVPIISGRTEHHWLYLVLKMVGA